MVNFNKCLLTMKYFFSQCFEVLTFRTKSKDDNDDNKYNIIEDNINNFIIIDTMFR
jgi:hypothetical protein